MTLYRLFPHRPDASIHEEGGALHVPRAHQGNGRHDSPDLYGALYLSYTRASAIAEHLKHHRGRRVGPGQFLWEREHYALALFDEARLEPLIDLDEPRELTRHGLRPSSVATRDRDVTQGYARAVHAEGAAGLAWWSTLESSWINVTLFAERAFPHLALAGEPEPVTTDHPAVREAAEVIGVTIIEGR